MNTIETFFKPAKIFILGAPDPEMNLIENILKAAKLPFMYASVNGERVSPATAYRADPWDDSFYKDGYMPVFVECRSCDVAQATSSGDLKVGHAGKFLYRGTGTEMETVAFVVDHHNEGDPGHSGSPEDFLSSSSIGQVLAMAWDERSGFGHSQGYVYIGGRWHLITSTGGKVEVPMEVVLAAASDHCPGHAYQGKCPGVDPDILAAWRAASKAAFRKLPVEAVLEEVAKGMAVLKELPVKEANGLAYVDAVGVDVPDLPEASLRLGITVQYSLLQRDQSIKVGVLNGTPEFLTAWMADKNSPESDLRDVYGSPERGYAGGYLK